jgi:RimJ/RimL family protein N-acetyltransferase
MIITFPQEKNIDELVELSGKFSLEHEWAGFIPIGNIKNRDDAAKRLFGENTVLALVAEDNSKLVGYIGIYKYDESYEASILIDDAYRKSGLGKRLCDEAFNKIPRNMEVEAWVGEFNSASINATPKMGFKLKRKFLETEFIPGREFMVYVFSRFGQLEC